MLKKFIEKTKEIMQLNDSLHHPFPDLSTFKVQPAVNVTAQHKLAWLMAELMAAQETYTEELKICGQPMPLNGAIFIIANAVSKLNSRSHKMFKIVKMTDAGVEEHARDLPTMRAVNEQMLALKDALPDGMPCAYDGQSLVIGNVNQGIAETIYRVELAA